MRAPDAVQPDEAAMVEALLRGDERAFQWLVQQHHTTPVRLALRYVYVLRWRELPEQRS